MNQSNCVCDRNECMRSDCPNPACRDLFAECPATEPGPVARSSAGRGSNINDRKAGVAWTERVGQVRTRTLAMLLGALGLLVIGLLAALAFLRPTANAPSAAPAPPTPSAPVEAGPTPEAPAVAQAQQSSQFGLNAQKLLDEMRTHDPSLSDEDAKKLVAVGDTIVAKHQLDWTADDPWIRGLAQQAFPQWDAAHLDVGTRCLAEYGEREEARLRGLPVPPDEQNEHNGQPWPTR